VISGLGKDAERALYKSFRKTVFYAANGKRQYFARLEQEYDVQKNILSKVSLPGNSAIGRFVLKSQNEELEIKKQGQQKHSDHVIHRLLVEYSIERIRDLLDYSKVDTERFVKAELILQCRAKRSRQQRIKNAGVIAGLTVAGLGAGWIAYSKFRNKKENDDDKK